MKPVHTPPAGGIKVDFLGIQSTICIHGRDSAGAVSVIELKDQPGGGAPMHVHQREDETFHVIEGDYEFTCGNQTFVAKPGATVFSPRGMPHGYRYLGKTPGRLLLFIAPAGIEEWFEEAGALDKQEVSTVIELGKKYGVEFLPPA
jgi:quercetin dioxygenase-like cupin family protein